MAGLVAVLYGVGAYALFPIAIFHTMVFAVDRVMPRSIVTGAARPLVESLILGTI